MDIGHVGCSHWGKRPTLDERRRKPTFFKINGDDGDHVVGMIPGLSSWSLLYSSVIYVTRFRLRWFGCLESPSDDDWITKCTGRWREGEQWEGWGMTSIAAAVGGDMKRLGVMPKKALDCEGWRDQWAKPDLSCVLCVVYVNVNFYSNFNFVPGQTFWVRNGRATANSHHRRTLWCVRDRSGINISYIFYWLLMQSNSMCANGSSFSQIGMSSSACLEIVRFA